MLPESFWVKNVVKKNFICKEKSGTVAEVIFTKIKKLRKLNFILELWYEHRIIIVEITHKTQTFFKHLLQRKQPHDA